MKKLKKISNIINNILRCFFSRPSECSITSPARVAQIVRTSHAVLNRHERHGDDARRTTLGMRGCGPRILEPAPRPSIRARERRAEGTEQLVADAQHEHQLDAARPYQQHGAAAGRRAVAARGVHAQSKASAPRDLERGCDGAARSTEDDGGPSGEGEGEGESEGEGEGEG